MYFENKKIKEVFMITTDNIVKLIDKQHERVKWYVQLYVLFLLSYFTLCNVLLKNGLEFYESCIGFFATIFIFGAGWLIMSILGRKIPSIIFTYRLLLIDQNNSKYTDTIIELICKKFPRLLIEKIPLIIMYFNFILVTIGMLSFIPKTIEYSDNSMLSALLKLVNTICAFFNIDFEIKQSNVISPVFRAFITIFILHGLSLSFIKEVFNFFRHFYNSFYNEEYLKEKLSSVINSEIIYKKRVYEIINLSSSFILLVFIFVLTRYNVIKDETGIALMFLSFIIMTGFRIIKMHSYINKHKKIIKSKPQQIDIPITKNNSTAQ
jgi:hypothetical protein